ncbi:MAG: acyltransferase [Sphingomonadales bacterium]|nr:acyltransferase [Sphingomonadales bacterium]
MNSASLRKPASHPGNRLVAVDGLRGIAAICVALMHAHIEWTPVWRGYLAVDFFFILSGFVIARAYEPRFAAGLSVREYAMQRIERLYPLLLIGSVMGLCVWLWGYGTFHPKSQADLMRALFGQFAMIPYLSTASSLAFDAALWSISFELLANVIHAVLYPRLSNRSLLVLMGLAFLLLARMDMRFGSLNVGWAADSALGGLGRVLFGFFFGVLLCRTEAMWKPLVPSLPFWVIGVVLTIVANMPLPSHANHFVSEAYDLIVVTAVLPALVVLGINATGGGRLALALGVLSFPIYAIHVPVVDGLRMAGFSLGFRLGAVAVLAVAAWALGRYVDEPLNAWRRAARKRGRPIRATAQPA